MTGAESRAKAAYYLAGADLVQLGCGHVFAPDAVPAACPGCAREETTLTCGGCGTKRLGAFMEVCYICGGSICLECWEATGCCAHTEEEMKPWRS